MEVFFFNLRLARERNPVATTVVVKIYNRGSDLKRLEVVSAPFLISSGRTSRVGIHVCYLSLSFAVLS